MYRESKNTSRALILFSLATALSALPLTSHAMDLYVGAGLGEARHEATGGDIAGPGFIGTVDGKENTWKAFLGMELWDKYVGAEFGYVDLGTAVANGTIAGASVSARSQAEAYTAALVGQLPIGNFGILIKLGISGVKASLTSRGTGAIASGHSADIKIFGGGGFQYYVSKKSILRFEADRYNMGSIGSPYINTLTVDYIYRFGK
ncbi:MAG: hypothetical protein HY081_03915 [Gammaproteobacteria bacterium]|nr:hypothetical protein [Gammaproteobacteria bacterium]